MASRSLRPLPGTTRSRGYGADSSLALLKGLLVLSVSSAILMNFFFMNKFFSANELTASMSAPSPPDYHSKHYKSVNSYYWPSCEDGGLLRKIYAVQNPTDCSTAKFLVWQSMNSHEKDTRGLTAWAHSGASFLFHALTDGDQFEKSGSRVLITDDKLWPMAKGCSDGPETRECYFEPLTKCTLADAIGNDQNKSPKLAKNGDDYDRSARTVYTSPTDIWFRPISNKYSWTGLPGKSVDHSDMFMVTTALAYYLRPKEWLKKEIDRRIRQSIPSDLDPTRTVGVPIRRSDKCMGHKLKGSAQGELDCPPLEKYLDGIKAFLEFDPLIENVILTSEDKSACEEFLQILRKELPKLRVVRNVGDVQQGTGSGSKLEAYVEESDNRNVVASALTSMHLHLRAKYFVITSKSTWTSTIAVMARNYGLASQIFVIDIGPNVNTYSSYARKGSI